jgi:Glyoxalase-like domain
MSKPAKKPRQARPIDHAVLPAGSLEEARQRLSQLGFTVAADGHHPFGTENACVYFPDDTFLEPLAVGQREDCETTARKGNVFTARDQAFRFRNGDDGFSALAFGTGDASRDHKSFKKAGISGGRKLSFSRKFAGPGGKKGKAGFLLAFAADLRAPDAFFFTCERVNLPKIDRSALQTHANGVTGIREVVLSEQNPTDFQYFLQDVVNNRETEAHSFGMEVAAGNGTVNVMTPEGLAIHYGVSRETTGRGLRLEGIVFEVAALDDVRTCLESHQIAHRLIQERIVVDAAPGQGCFFAFAERART